LRSAARDCVPQDRSSFVSFQASTGVEVRSLRVLSRFLVRILLFSFPFNVKV